MGELLALFNSEEKKGSKEKMPDGSSQTRRTAQGLYHARSGAYGLPQFPCGLAKGAQTPTPRRGAPSARRSAALPSKCQTHNCYVFERRGFGGQRATHEGGVLSSIAICSQRLSALASRRRVLAVEY